ncbi:MAG: hypothetical protein R3282_03115, partial [Rhodothermales bacterium]|nr:hypothetical protein [Rhodothermales bacterium]
YEQRFHPLLEKLSQLERRYVLRDLKSKRLNAIIQDVPSLEAALAIMARLTSEPVPAEER